MSTAGPPYADERGSPDNSIAARRSYRRLIAEALAAVDRRAVIVEEELREAYWWSEQPLGRTYRGVDHRVARWEIMQKG